MASIERRETAGGAVRWTMRVFMGRDPETGKRKYVVRTFDRKTDADKEARRLERMKDAGGLTAPSKEPLSRYLATWLDTKEGEIRARTLYDYRGIVRRYIQKPPDDAPPLGTIPLNRLTPHAFEGLYTWLRKEKDLSPRTIQYLHSVLRQALGDAVRKGALPRNPTDHAKRSKKAKDGEENGGKENDRDAPERVMRAMSEEEAGRFLEAAREDRYFALWTLLLTGGIRPGEALGLKWKDVNLDESRVHVRRSLTRTGVPKPCGCGHERGDHGDGGKGACRAPGCRGCKAFKRPPDAKGWRLTPPKTKKARRVVPLPSVTIRALREWRKVQAAERLQLGPEYEDNGFVFATEFGHPLDRGNIGARNFRRIMARANLGEWETVLVGRKVKKETRRFRPAFRVYDLRHTCATLLLLKEVSAKVVAERLGHSSIVLTLDTYSHVLPDMQEKAVEAMEAAFGTGS